MSTRAGERRESDMRQSEEEKTRRGVAENISVESEMGLEKKKVGHSSVRVA